MTGILYSIVAGLIVAMQGVVNTRLSEKAGFWLTNAFVHGSGFAVSLLILAIMRDGSAGGLMQASKAYWLGGVMGVGIVFAVMKGMGTLGPSYSVALLMIAQLIFALLIDSFGWFGTRAVPFTWNKAAGIAIMIAGILVMKWK
ncbi:DMT family transporter [Paenibacillus xanthanilyticus]|uniref:DMT family transporter n=1 Tax=Paenibacillus xanthanilyticus TaxID=1783531 RepID=A0ABV8JZL8_9BACL